MKTLFYILVTFVFLAGCTSSTWIPEGRKGQILLPGIKAVTGGHCESSALLNALNYQGYAFTEAEIVGISGAMGFMYEKGEFPFLGSRSLLLKEDFFQSAGIKWHVGDNSTADKAWLEAIKVLEEGNPVILHVDMRYLTYLWGGKYGSIYTSFGWHIICLFGVDFDKKEAYVTDTALPGLQTIKLNDLDKARSSQTKVLTPEYKWYWAEKAPESYSPDWDNMLVDSLSRLIRNYETLVPEELQEVTIGGLKGLEQFPGEIRNIEKSVKPWLLEPVFSSLYGWIEEYGTGGAAFRIFTRDFFKSAYEKTGNENLPKAINLLNKAIASWHDLSAGFKKIGREIGRIKKADQKTLLYDKAADKAKELYNNENEFYLYLKEILK